MLHLTAECGGGSAVRQLEVSCTAIGEGLWEVSRKRPWKQRNNSSNRRYRKLAKFPLRHDLELLRELLETGCDTHL